MQPDVVNQDAFSKNEEPTKTTFRYHGECPSLTRTSVLLMELTAQNAFAFVGGESDNAVWWRPLPHRSPVPLLQPVCLTSSSIDLCQNPKFLSGNFSPHTLGLGESQCRSLQLSLQGCLLLGPRAFQAQRKSCREAKGRAS